MPIWFRWTAAMLLLPVIGLAFEAAHNARGGKVIERGQGGFITEAY